MFDTAQGDDDRLSGGEGNDKLYGDGAVIVEDARGGDDWLFDGAGSDFVHGGSGSGVINGETGDDTAAFDGPVGSHAIASRGNAILVTHLPSGDVDTVTGAEWLAFLDDGDIITLIPVAGDTGQSDWPAFG